MNQELIDKTIGMNQEDLNKVLDFIKKVKYSDFTNYVYSFYGQGGVYKRFFEKSPVTKNEIEMLYQISLTKDVDFWSNEDSLCREVMRDLLFSSRDIDSDLEHQWYLDKFYSYPCDYALCVDSTK